MGSGGSRMIGNYGSVIENFRCKYIGSVPVAATAGVDVAESGMARILKLKTPEIAVQLVVTDCGIVMIDKTGEAIKLTEIGSVSFTQSHSTKNNLVCYFEDDSTNHMVICHMFRFPSEAIVFPIAVQDAFEANANLDIDDGDEDNFDSRLVWEPSSSSRGGTSSPPVSGGIGRMRSASNASILSSKKRNSLNKKELRKRASDIMPSVQATVVPEDKLREVDGVYFGRIAVGAEKGEGMAREAMSRILAKGSEKEQCVFQIYANAIKLTKAMGFSEEVIHNNRISECTYALYDESKDMFCYIIRDDIRSTLEAMLIGVPKAPPGEKSLRREIDTAQRDYATKLKEAGEVSERRDTFDAIYIGSVGVPTIDDPLKVCETAYKMSKKQVVGDLVFLQVFGAGIRIFDGLTIEVQFSMSANELMFTTTLGPKKDIFCFLQNNAHLGEKVCLLFQLTAPERAAQVLHSFTRNFGNKMAHPPRKGSLRTKDNSVTTDNPFQGEGDRIAAPGNLFKRQIHRADLEAIKVIGAGQFGQVYMALKRDPKSSEKVQVAVKTLKDVKSAADRQEFVHEAEVMLETNHKNLLGLIGVAVQQKPWLMVLDCMDYGDLRKLMVSAKAKGVNLSQKELLLITKECAHGMSYMEQIGFAHCDLAARNVLVGPKNSFKVADFGMCRRLRQRARWNGPKVMKVAIRWSSIEVLEDRVFSIQSDVWAFGILVWEIYAYGEMPYPGMNNAQVHRLLDGGGRMKAPSGMPKSVYGTIKGCWKESPSARPKFKELKADMDLFFRNSNDAPPRDIGKTVKEAQAVKHKKTSGDNSEFYYSSTLHGMKKRSNAGTAV